MITFYYTKRTDLSYTVHYYEQGTTKDLATAKTVNDQIYKAEVTEKAIDIAGYNKVTPASKTITIDVAGNEIIFEYTKRNDLGYQVNYLEQGTNTVLSTRKTVTGKTYQEEITEQAIDIPGYNKVDPTSETFKVDVEEKVINFYYTKRTDLGYTVHYLEAGAEGTDIVLSPEKSVSGKTFQDEVTERAIEIPI